MHVQKYAESLNKEIDKLIRSEGEKMTEKGEGMLHVLLENCKHIIWWNEHYGNMPATADNPKKSYFGENPY